MLKESLNKRKPLNQLSFEIFALLLKLIKTLPKNPHLVIDPASDKTHKTIPY